ncbi:MAG: hypothetical protein JNK30_17675 [Phenylobacterium sp.]|uniref:hypothetical protein n=1 Tax=Phenylobacterium sp. TaxID=1871053 RepID=UPI001A484425|nr:hypothetical protein [Phenylobacterium sp.]MBL8773216.1 hypothetical protein [Phenylobacterium sp.]
MSDKLKIAGIVFLGFLALGAGWALWMGLKLLAWIAGVALALGVAAGVAWGARSRKRLAGPADRSRLS